MIERFRPVYLHGYVSALYVIARFCGTFPDAFYVSERARIYLDPKGEKGLTGRLLSAGFHNQMGYFRDDGPLSELLLDDLLLYEPG